MLQIMADVGLVEVQPSGSRFVAIALFAHRERHDPQPGIGQGIQHFLQVLRRKEVTLL